jgi:hypothetical protein
MTTEATSTISATSAAISIAPAAESKPIIHAAPPIHVQMVNADATMLRDIATKHQAGKAELTITNRHVNPNGSYSGTVQFTVDAPEPVKATVEPGKAT